MENTSAMKNKVIGKFKDKPRTNTGWWVLYLGFATLLLPVMLGTFIAGFRPIIDPVSVNQGNTGISMGMGAVLVALILSICTIITFVRAYKSGERSWVLWTGLIPAVLVGGFWSFMIIGEFIFPH